MNEVVMVIGLMIIVPGLAVLLMMVVYDLRDEINQAKRAERLERPLEEVKKE